MASVLRSPVPEAGDRRFDFAVQHERQCRGALDIKTLYVLWALFNIASGEIDPGIIMDDLRNGPLHHYRIFDIFREYIGLSLYSAITHNAEVSPVLYSPVSPSFKSLLSAPTPSSALSSASMTSA